jgi:hypothetical protein
MPFPDALQEFKVETRYLPPISPPLGLNAAETMRSCCRIRSYGC